MLCRVAALCRSLRSVLLLVSFPRSRSPVVGELGLCWLRRVPTHPPPKSETSGEKRDLLKGPETWGIFQVRKPFWPLGPVFCPRSYALPENGAGKEAQGTGIPHAIAIVYRKRKGPWSRECAVAKSGWRDCPHSVRMSIKAGKGKTGRNINSKSYMCMTCARMKPEANVATCKCPK